jgi:N-acetylglucosamine malate deacetylase 2
MGRVRLREMERMKQVLELSGMTVLDFPDSGLAAMDPRSLEEAIRHEILRVRPQVLVTYPVHGVSGHPDHLVTHAVVKRVHGVLCEEEGEAAPLRLAFFTLEEPDPDGRLSTSSPEEIDVAEEVTDADRERARRALACYETYREVIEKTDPLGTVGTTVHFELFQESHDPRLGTITQGLGEA